MYFKVLAVAFGGLMVLKGPVAMLLGRRIDPLKMVRLYPKERPTWAWAVALLDMALIGVTWWMQCRAHVAWSWPVTLMVTLSAVKQSQVLFNYRRFRRFVLLMDAGRPHVMLALNIVTAVAGIALVLLGILVY